VTNGKVKFVANKKAQQVAKKYFGDTNNLLSGTSVYLPP
jgi:hypothetical protein